MTEKRFATTPHLAAYVIAVLVFAAWVAASAWTRQVPPAWGATWIVAALVLLMVPRRPEAALFGVVLMAYGAPFASNELSLLVDVYVLNVMCTIALAGWYLFGRAPRDAEARGDWVTGLMAVFVLWVVLSLAVALLSGTPWQPFPKHHPTKYYQALVVFFLASRLLDDRAGAAGFAGAVCVTVVLRALLQGDAGLYLDSYTSQLSVLLLPVALIGLLFSNRPVAKVGFAILLLALARHILVAQNRAALVGLIAIAAVLVWHHRSKWRWAVLVLPAVVLVIVVAFPASYLDRFRALWEPGVTQRSGMDRSTARGRIELWEAGLSMLKDNPVSGVGPGNYARIVGAYAPGKDRLQAHNNYIGIAAETGLPGLALYVAVFVSAILSAGVARKSGNPPWRRRGGEMIQASIVGYMALGFFSTRHDLILAFLIAGWAVALARQSVVAPGAQKPAG